MQFMRINNKIDLRFAEGSIFCWWRIIVSYKVPLRFSNNIIYLHQCVAVALVGVYHFVENLSTSQSLKYSSAHTACLCLQVCLCLVFQHQQLVCNKLWLHQLQSLFLHNASCCLTCLIQSSKYLMCNSVTCTCMHENIRPGLKRWITLSTGEITIQQITWFVLLTFIHWIAIYPVDSVIQP